MVSIARQQKTANYQWVTGYKNRPGRFGPRRAIGVLLVVAYVVRVAYSSIMRMNLEDIFSTPFF
jgi:hypothetical protein